MNAGMLSVCAVLITAVGYVQCWAKSAPPDRDSLAGLSGIYVSVETCPEAEKHGISKTKLQADATRQLRNSGIEVLSEQTWEQTPGMPMLSIEVTVVTKAGLKNSAAVGVCARFIQNVLLERAPTSHCRGAVTWEMSELHLTTTAAIKDAAKTVDDYLSQFIADYLAVNPLNTQAGQIRDQNVLPGLIRPEPLSLTCPKCGFVFVPRKGPQMPGFFPDRCPQCHFSPAEDAIKRRGLKPDQHLPQ